MAYSIDGRDIVINGWEKGISDDPYTGTSDMRGMNIISIPGESSVNFSTLKISTPTLTTGSVTTTNAGTDVFTYTGATGGLEDGMAVIFSATTVTGLSTTATYWVKNSTSTTFKLETTFAGGTFFDVTNDGTGTFTAQVMGTPKYYAYDNHNDTYWLVDSNGRVWTNKAITFSGYWKFTGNLIDSTSNGNGLLYFEPTDGAGYIFVFRNSRIDYTAVGTVSWVYGWDPIDGTTGNTDAYLNNPATDNRNHHAIVGQGNTVYYTDNQYVGSWFQSDPAVPFVPTTLSTYSFAKQAVGIESSDSAICICMLGQNVLIGGSKNAIYVWNRLSYGYQYRILIAESTIIWMETINTSTYIFAGNRGRIYITNGSQAKLFKKVPDHLSGTVEPYFTWGGVASIKNQLYFGIKATTNNGVALPYYGGLWAIDIDTNALRMTNQLSYGTYAGYATLVIPRVIPTVNPYNPNGAGLFIGWEGGLDVSSANPYSTYVAYIDTENLPIATFLQKRTLENVEFKLTVPLVSGEGVQLYYRQNFNDSFTLIGETTTVGAYSDVFNVNFENSQWLQFRIMLKSTTSSDRTYTRFKELRIR